VAGLTEATSVTFMGMSIACAKCHNHPLEKWTQDQYWAFANLFSRVGIKNGDRTNELLVQAQPAGDAPHLRKGVALPPTPLDARPWPSTPRATAGVLRRLAHRPEQPVLRPGAGQRIWRNFLGAGWSRPRTTSGRPTRRPTRRCSTPWRKTSPPTATTSST